MQLYLRLVRALQRVDDYPRYFIHNSCESLQISFCQVLNRGLNLDVLMCSSGLNWSKLGVHKMRQKQPPK